MKPENFFINLYHPSCVSTFAIISLLVGSKADGYSPMLKFQLKKGVKTTEFVFKTLKNKKNDETVKFLSELWRFAARSKS